nr:hypothetical protein Iba_chr05dCG2280 [Ipomoea batatas]
MKKEQTRIGKMPFQSEGYRAYREGGESERKLSEREFGLWIRSKAESRDSMREKHKTMSCDVFRAVDPSLGSDEMRIQYFGSVTGEKRGAEGRRRLVTGELRVKPTVERLVSREEIDEEQSTGCRARQQPTVQASTKCRRQAVGGDATGAYEFRSRLTSIEHLSKLTLVSFDILYVYC